MAARRYRIEQRRRPSRGKSRTGLAALPARHARVALFGVRQPRCRSSRAHDQAWVTPFTLPVAGMLCDLVAIMHLSISNRLEYADPTLESAINPPIHPGWVCVLDASWYGISASS